MLIDISILSPTRVIFSGKVKVAAFPGEQGVFEVLSFHKRMMSRLITGVVYVDDKEIPVKRGICKVDQNKIIAVVEER